MQTLVEPRAILENSNTEEPELEHYVCNANEDIALCGTDVSNHAWSNDNSTDDMCVVCVELEMSVPCVQCGRECWNE